MPRTRGSDFSSAPGNPLSRRDPRLSLSSQTESSSTIENGIVRRVGGTKEIRVDARIIAAAKSKIFEVIKQGGFREDLFHRLDLQEEVGCPPR